MDGPYGHVSGGIPLNILRRWTDVVGGDVSPPYEEVAVWVSGK